MDNAHMKLHETWVLVGKILDTGIHSGHDEVTGKNFLIKKETTKLPVTYV
jgi:hypothetical protein